MITSQADASRRKDGIPDDAALTLQFRKGETRLTLYTLLASLGTPLDIGVERLGLEFFLPADDETDRWFKDAATTTAGAVAR